MFWLAIVSRESVVLLLARSNLAVIIMGYECDEHSAKSKLARLDWHFSLLH